MSLDKLYQERNRSNDWLGRMAVMGTPTSIEFNDAIKYYSQGTMLLN